MKKEGKKKKYILVKKITMKSDGDKLKNKSNLMKPKVPNKNNSPISLKPDKLREKSNENISKIKKKSLDSLPRRSFENIPVNNTGNEGSTSSSDIELTTIGKKTRSSSISSPIINSNSPKISLSLAKSKLKNKDNLESKTSSSNETQSISISTKLIAKSKFEYGNKKPKKRKSSVLNESISIDSAVIKQEVKNNKNSKKIKLEEKVNEVVFEKNLRPKKKITESETANKALQQVKKKCKICQQILNDSTLKLYCDNLDNALEEQIALTNSSLCVENEGDVITLDNARPSIKITYFSVYDKARHLCSIDNGLIERNVLLYFSGYMKRIDASDSDIQGGVATKDAGPINEWWVSGYDGGEKALIGISTPLAEYYLMEPSPEYATFMINLIEKVYICKLVIEFLLEEENPTFEDLLDKIQMSVQPPGVPRLTEDILIKHAQFVSDQVLSISTSLDESVPSLITTPCMRSLIRLAAITFAKRKKMKRNPKNEIKIKKTNFIKATTTPLVKDTFDSFFTSQLDGSTNSKKNRSNYQRCGICEICQLPDCGTCSACKEKVKGSKKSANVCVKRKCPNMAIQELDDSDPDDEEFYQKTAEEKAKNQEIIKSRQVRSHGGKKEVKWIGQPIYNDGRKIYYRCAKVGNEEFVAGDCVSVEPANQTSPLIIGRVMYMWENKIGQKYMHAQWFCRGTETVLGETADPHELFVVDECDNSLLSCIHSKVKVAHKDMSANWHNEGGYPLSRFTIPVNRDDAKSFFYQKRYNVIYGRFEDLLPSLSCPIKLAAHRFCVSCDRLFRQRKFDIIFVDEKLENVSNEKEVYYGVVKWKGEEYRPGSGVFLSPHIFEFKLPANIPKENNKKTDKMDEDKYPEYYRKSSEYIKGCNISTPKPFCIGIITEIKTNLRDRPILSSDICLKVIKLYRPENTNIASSQRFQSDLNVLFISDEEVIVSFEEVVGKCAVVYSENLMENLKSWAEGGPNRFYFRKAYNSKTNTFSDPTKEAKLLGNVIKNRGRGKVKGKDVRTSKKTVEIESWPKISRPLRCLDVFAGCGGLSDGLHRSGVCETKWAIEHQTEAAEAFRLNNKSCTVFTEDCNELLKQVMSGEKKNKKGDKLPQKGDVELLCGGPPCQGFSGMNRFNTRQYYLFKNSLIATYLSYCDYYRPRFFILENVRNFVSFKRSMVLKLTIRCLQRMGYQVAFGILQAGNYGVPQTRRRAIILAAAPGEVLPNFPEPLHVFNPRETQLTVVVDDKKFISSCRWNNSAPYRTITVRDAISDLPKISNGFKDVFIPYGKDAASHFQKIMRGEQTVCQDHICKEMAPIVLARISNIPVGSGSDWRDLPNIVVKLSDDTYTQKLQYTYKDKSKSNEDTVRGVCACAEGKPCNPSDRQFNTLIPWCLPHTANRHNNWAGLYGRLEWDGFFCTTTTNPEPMSKQGRVLHPDQTRVVSVREFARSQGFPDSYIFYGSVLDKHRQVGNAVPPPLAAAIGREIRKCISMKEQGKNIEKTLDSKHVAFEKAYDTS